MFASTFLPDDTEMMEVRGDVRPAARQRSRSRPASFAIVESVVRADSPDREGYAHKKRVAADIYDRGVILTGGASTASINTCVRSSASPLRSPKNRDMLL
jgi:hypothetical protein